MIKGETILSGASDICPDCKKELVLEVHSSAAGYYLGTWCNCGPYSRESDYYQDLEQAKSDLAQTRNECYWK